MFWKIAHPVPEYFKSLSTHIFRSRKKFSTTYAIVSFFLCFFSRPFMKISNFSKTVHTIIIKLCTVILHPKGPLHAQRHQNRIQPFFDFFSRRFSREKCPTLTVASFFFFFFSSDYNLTLIGPLFSQSKLLKLLA